MPIPLFNFYWIASTTARVLFLLLLPVIIWFQSIFISYVIVATSIGWLAIFIALYFKCPSCRKRALVHTGVVVKKIETKRNGLSKWIVPDELFHQYFYCCKCGHKVEAKSC